MVSRIYDRVSSTYDSDWNGIYRQSREININQILKHVESGTLTSALDLAVGTGNAFYDLSKHLTIKHRIGNDISKGMLDRARDKLTTDFVGICDDVLNIDKHVPSASQDLVLCHFIFSYVNPLSIMERAYRLLKPGGLLSIATSTQQALAEMHREHFPISGRLLAVNSSLEKAPTPSNHDALREMVCSNGFDILEEDQYREETSFHSFADVTDWALGSGWAAQYFDRHYWIKQLGARIWFASAKVLFPPFYPVTATNDISLLLVRRPLE